MKRFMLIVCVLLYISAGEPYKTEVQDQDRGYWIWHPADKANICTFRKKVTIKDKPSNAVITITCDNVYQLFVNGTLLGHNRSWEDTEEYSLDKILQVGENEIIVEGSDTNRPAGLWCQLEWKEGEKQNAVFTSGDWEVYEGKKDFKDPKWVKAKQVGKYPCEPWGDVLKTTSTKIKMIKEIEKTLSVEGIPEFLPPKEKRSKIPPEGFRGVWLEAESAEKHNLKKTEDPKAFEGAFLSVSSETLPKDGYFAQYTLNVTRSGWYELWFSGRNTRKEFQAPVSWSLDGKKMGDLNFLPKEGESYTCGYYEFVWSQLAVMRLDQGKHTIEFKMGEKGEGHKYTFWMDSIVAWCAWPDEKIVCTSFELEDVTTLGAIKFKAVARFNIKTANINFAAKRLDCPGEVGLTTVDSSEKKIQQEFLCKEPLDPRLPPPRFEITLTSEEKTLCKKTVVVGIDVFNNLPRDSQLDEYGGYNQVNGKKTGYFHTEKIGDRWWLVTPEGHGFFSKGMDVLQMLDHWSSPFTRYTQRHYMSEENFARYNIGRLRYLGFNSLGFWTTEITRKEARRQKMPYFINLHLLNCLYGSPLESADGRKWMPLPHSPWGWCVSDPYSPESKRRLLERCSILDPNDPWLIGYFIDNECPLPPAEFLYSKHTYSAWQEFLKKRYSNISDLNKKWSSKHHQYKYSGFDQIHTDVPLVRGTDDPVQRDVKDFQHIVVEHAVELAMECIKTYDKNHMICGLRFAGNPNHTGVSYETLKKFNVNSINFYGSDPRTGISSGFISAPRNLANNTETPVLLTEFNASATDQFGDIGLGGKFPNQHERTKAIASMMLTLSAQPWLVGWHYFCWQDSNTSENYNAGLVNWKDEIYEPFGSALKTILPLMDHVILNSTFSGAKGYEKTLLGPHIKIDSSKIVSERGQGGWFWTESADYIITDGSFARGFHFQTKDGAAEKKYIKAIGKDFLLLGGPMKVTADKEITQIDAISLSGAKRPVKIEGGKNFVTLDGCFIYQVQTN